MRPGARPSAADLAGCAPELDLHPAESTAAATFEAAAQTARSVAVDCLPLGIALVMHLYPLCALRCVPLPWWSAGECPAVTASATPSIAAR